MGFGHLKWLVCHHQYQHSFLWWRVDRWCANKQFQCTDTWYWCTDQQHAAELLQLYTLFQATSIACRQADALIDLCQSTRPIVHSETTTIYWHIMSQFSSIGTSILSIDTSSIGASCIGATCGATEHSYIVAVLCLVFHFRHTPRSREESWKATVWSTSSVSKPESLGWLDLWQLSLIYKSKVYIISYRRA